ncbi:MAG: CHAT domain-containing protein [Caulobacterales bacterium]|nr:CHAT domain-containing protein [Caulobacterales bacterium]
MAGAVRLYFDGHAVAARERLIRLLDEPAAAAPAARVAVLGALLDICLHSYATDCATTYAPRYAEAAAAAPAPEGILRQDQALRVSYYLDAARFRQGGPGAAESVLAGPAWSHENAYDGALYLQRQGLAADILLSQGRLAEATARADRILSLIASLKAPASDRFAVAYALTDTLRTLMAAGQIERAYGLYRASGASIGQMLAPRSVDAAVFQLTAAQLLQAVGDTEGATKAAGAAVAVLTSTELDAPVRDRLLGQAQDLQGLLHALHGGQAGAEALKLPAGAARPEALTQLARRIREAAGARNGTPGAWYRPSALDQLLIGLALAPGEAGRPGPEDPDLAFALFQLAARQGPSFDADALTALSQARDPLARRSIHEALRLRQRRDRLERTAIQAVAQAAAAGHPPLANLEHDVAVRQQFRLFAERIAAADRQLTGDRVVLGGANIAPLDRFQAVLAPDEAALIAAPVAGGLAYMCVRHDATFRAFAAVDGGRLRLDERVLQAALSATYAPSEDLDAQFPAEAAVRLYDAFVRPFEPCLKPGDRIVWLPGMASLGLPLAALLPHAPPRSGAGYDLAQADWLAKAHATSYAGSASAVLAARAVPRAAAAFDFLGVGDPLLSGTTAEGEARGRAVLRGVRGGAFADLAELPETKDELVASAHGFRQVRLLTEADATERRFRDELVGGYRLLSFATHGLLRDDLQGLSEPALVLTPVSTRDAADDGLLTASEIADFNLSAQFVALSACNTANFDLSEAAQDLPALASAFAVAGAPSTLGTLWPVNSEVGRRVVAATFAGLREDPTLGPAQALARAQRAFLAAPPSRAWLHPRFWAPFVILGDGGAITPAPASGPRLSSVETLAADGEGLSVRRDGSGAIARFIDTPTAGARHDAGLRVTNAQGAEAWRQDQAGPGASPFTATVGSHVVAAGYEVTPQRMLSPILQAFDRATGALVETWRPDVPAAGSSAILAGATTGKTLVAVVADVTHGRAEPSALRALAFDERLRPRTLFEVRAGRSGGIDAATLTPVNGDLMLTYTIRYAPLSVPAPAGWDDYDDALCASEPVTWIELHDGRTGALKASREVRDLDVNAAVARGREVWLGGATRGACGEDEHAAIQAVDLRLSTRPLYVDTSVGASWIWSLSATPAGGAFAAGSKQSVLDFGVVRVAAPVALGAPTGTSGLVFTLGPRGQASPPTLLASGSDVYVNGGDASRPDDILLPGALGGNAVVFHFAARP